ncbi:hypothetical protein [Rubellicoccus peritrichatus]|uniref:SH3 domain-containing protein n=1 Tax=Rubellicoccus peritrichatus TaxID=3080537 RepID=A0AAQ3LDN7_9BACT|nr:hypothetical protein [Puniceicoccus sp. CR14]WOO41653.1 hypothetical protein RZN69_01035 [Puniceicoccus sp. CR14]
MKRLACILGYSIQIILLPFVASAQEQVSLFLEPNDTGTVFAKETLEDINSMGPTPYPADQEVTEWMTVDYTGNYVGYVEPANINKDLTVRKGSPILLQPKRDSRTLTIVDDTVSPQIIELGDDWVTVYYNGNAPAYFQWPSNTAAAEPEIVTVTSAPVVASTETVTEAPLVITDTPPPASTVAAPPPPVLEEIAVTQQPQVLPMPPPAITSKQIIRTWEGKIVEIKGISGWFNEYDYALEDPQGKRIAYVDFNGVLLFKPMDAYLDVPVVIDGTAEKIVNTTPILIKARFIRFK